MIPEGGIPRQVFVDDSGRRRRWTRVAGAGVTALCATYIAVTAVGLSQTTVGPLLAVPESTSGQVAGFPDSDGTVPGLLAGGIPAGVPKAARVPKAAAEPKTAARAPRKTTETDKETKKTKPATQSPAKASTVASHTAGSRSATSGSRTTAAA